MNMRTTATWLLAGTALVIGAALAAGGGTALAGPPTGPGATPSSPPKVCQLVEYYNVKILGEVITQADGKKRPYYEPGVELVVIDAATRQRGSLYMKSGTTRYEELKDLLKQGGVKPGDYLKVHLDAAKGPGGISLIASAGAYAFMIGEDRPNVYVFEGTTSRSAKTPPAEFVGAALRRLGREHVFVIPNTARDANGRPQADKDLLARLGDLHKGDLVEVKTGTHAGLPAALNLSKCGPFLRGMFVGLAKGTVADTEYYAAVVALSKEEVAYYLLANAAPATRPAGAAATQPAGGAATRPAGGAVALGDRLGRQALRSKLANMAPGTALEFSFAPGMDGLPFLTSARAAAAMLPGMMAAGGGGTASAGGGGQRMLAYVAFGTVQRYVSNLTPIVTAGAVAYQPTIGSVPTGTVLNVIDVVVRIERDTK